MSATPLNSVTNRLAQCSWPPLAAPFAEALREATQFVFGEVDPIGIIATGTIIRGEAHVNSDLDVYVIHAAAYRRRVQRFFAGVPAEIFINPAESVRDYFVDEHRDGRPLTAHMLATGFVVYSSAAIVDELRREAQEWLARPSPMSDDQAMRARYGIACRLEDGFDLLPSDGPTATMLLSQAVTSMLEFFCRSRAGRVPRSKQLLSTVAAYDTELGQLATAFFTAESVADRARIAEALADRIIGVRGFFPWDSGSQSIATRTD